MDDSSSLLNDVHGDHNNRTCPAILLPVPGAKADGNGLPDMVLAGLAGFRVLGDGALLNVEETRPVAMVVWSELSTGLDSNATHAELAPGHPPDLICEIQCGQHLRPEALAVRRRHLLLLLQREPRQHADEPSCGQRTRECDPTHTNPSYFVLHKSGCPAGTCGSKMAEWTEAAGKFSGVILGAPPLVAQVPLAPKAECPAS